VFPFGFVSRGASIAPYVDRLPRPPELWRSRNISKHAHVVHDGEQVVSLRSKSCVPAIPTSRTFGVWTRHGSRTHVRQRSTIVSRTREYYCARDRCKLPPTQTTYHILLRPSLATLTSTVISRVRSIKSFLVLGRPRGLFPFNYHDFLQ